MQTRCPECQTVFRVTPEQLKARAGNVRCGQCQTAFNALDSLLEALPTAPLDAPQPNNAMPPGDEPVAAPVASTRAPAELHFLPLAEESSPAAEAPAPTPAVTAHDEITETVPAHDTLQAAPLPTDVDTVAIVAPPHAPAPQAMDAAGEPQTDAPALTPSQAQALGKATGLILPRETTEIPGYSKWTEGVMTTPLTLPPEKTGRGPFAFTGIVLALLLAGQLAYHYRGELAAWQPSLRPLLATLSESFGSTLPLPRHSEQISIETSDLQTDSARGNLLVLSATVRNRAAYGQDFPALELTLTDTGDSPLVRKVFQPADYLPGGLPADATFPPQSDVAIRLWLDGQGVAAAGYRLFVFYP